MMTNRISRLPETDKQPEDIDPEFTLERHILDIQYNLSMSLAFTDDLIEGMELCLDACLQVPGMDCGGIYLFDEEKKNLNLMVHKGLSTEFVNSGTRYDENSKHVALIKTGRPIYSIIQDLKDYFTNDQLKEGLRAFGNLPLLDESEAIGCINISSHTVDEFNASSRIAIETVAAQAGIVIARLKSRRLLQESEEQLRSLMMNAEKFAIFRLASCEKDTRKLKVVFASPSIKEIMGLESPLLFETWFDNIHAEDRERIFKAHSAAFQAHEFNEEMKIVHPRKNEHRWVQCISKGIIDPNGNTKYVNGIIVDITKRKLYENELSVKEQELEKKTCKLMEVNTALNVLLRKMENDKAQYNKKIIGNIQKLVRPYIDKLKNTKINVKQKVYLDIIESNLNNIISPSYMKLSSEDFGLTPTEIKVANLINKGKKTKEIADFLGVSYKTVEVHRMNIRKKIGIKNKKVNLQTHLALLAKN